MLLVQARKVQFKDAMEEEWERFQKSIQQEEKVGCHYRAMHCSVVHTLAGLVHRSVSHVCWRWSEVGWLVARRRWRYKRRMTQLQRMTENWKK